MSTETENFSFKTKAHISISRVDHSTSIMNNVDDIFQKQLFTDVCLSCENQIINAHRLILAASTSFFHSLFSTQPCCLNPNPVIVMRDIKINELKAILEFIYYGKVVVPETELSSLIKSAESLGVYGLSKLNPEQINESKDDDQQKDDYESETEINNNIIINSLIDLKESRKTRNDNEQLDKMIPASQEKNKRKSMNNTEDNNGKDLEEKRKKKELTNQAGDQTNNQQLQSANQQPATQDTSQLSQSSSKRQSLRIKYRKNNPELSKDQTTNAFDLLNTSNNSEISLSDAIASNGKRLKRSDSDSHLEDESMSVDGSEYCANKRDHSQEKPKNTNNNSTSLLSVNKILIKERALRLKRNKNSILQKANNDLIKKYKLMPNKTQTLSLAKRQLDELGSQSGEILSDEEDDSELANEDNIVLKKIDSPRNNNLNTSRKNSLDSNNGHNDSLIKLTNKSTLNDKKESEESPTSTGNQSLVATSSLLTKQQNQQQKKKKRKISMDNA